MEMNEPAKTNTPVQLSPLVISYNFSMPCLGFQEAVVHVQPLADRPACGGCLFGFVMLTQVHVVESWAGRDEQMFLWSQ